MPTCPITFMISEQDDTSFTGLFFLFMIICFLSLSLTALFGFISELYHISLSGTKINKIESLKGKEAPNSAADPQSLAKETLYDYENEQLSSITSTVKQLRESITRHQRNTDLPYVSNLYDVEFELLTSYPEKARRFYLFSNYQKIKAKQLNAGLQSILSDSADLAKEAPKGLKFASRFMKQSYDSLTVFDTEEDNEFESESSDETVMIPSELKYDDILFKYDNYNNNIDFDPQDKNVTSDPIDQDQIQNTKSSMLIKLDPKPPEPFYISNYARNFGAPINLLLRLIKHPLKPQTEPFNMNHHLINSFLNRSHRPAIEKSNLNPFPSRIGLAKSVLLGHGNDSTNNEKIFDKHLSWDQITNILKVLQ